MSWNGFTEDWLKSHNERKASHALLKDGKDQAPKDMAQSEMRARRGRKLPHSQARKTIRDGIIFPSKLEADRYTELCLLKIDGTVEWFIRQTPFHFPDGNKMVVDFFVFYPDGSFTIEDTKGRVLPAFKRKLKSFRYFYPTLSLTVLYRKDVEQFTDEQHELLITRRQAA